MDAEERARLKAQHDSLRVALKDWENAWRKAHDGQKPSRDDIKQNPDIGRLHHDSRLWYEAGD